ncbi:MAG: ROK family transcriptional regulator [Devosia sp.]
MGESVSRAATMRNDADWPKMHNSKLRIARSVDQGVVRHANTRAVLTEIALHPDQSAAMIAKKLGLGPQTVGRLVGDLVETGFVVLGETTASGPGKPGTPLGVVPNAAFAIGCEIGLEYCELLMLNIKGQTLGSHRWYHEILEPERLLKQVSSIADLLVNVVPLSDRSRITGLALVTPADMAGQSHEMGGSDELAARWADFDLTAALAGATGLPVTQYIDGSAACWGELARLRAPRPGRMCYFFISTFVIAGVVAEGRLLEGGSNRSTDLGASLVPDEHGRLARLHTVAGLQALLQDPLAQTIASFGTDPMDWDWTALEPAVVRWLERAGKALAVAIANAAAAVGCELAIIDATLPASVLDRLIESVRKNMKTLPTLPISLEQGQAGVSAPAHGAAALLMYRSFFSGEWDHFPLEIQD